MKKKVRFSCYAVMVVAFTFLNVSVVSGQGNVSITAGFGFPDLINAGIRYQIEQVQIGISAGFLPVEGESVTSALFDVHYHFAGSSEFSTRKPWYGRLGVSYLHDKKEGSFNEKFVFFGLRVGREFNISQHFGIALDAGLMYKLYSDVEEND
ncbi:MAG: hypothetical protein JXR41_06055, partial [Bacteroidales bacterium]|nr:hypothetical protein [Bacteroidales bacterium]